MIKKTHRIATIKHQFPFIELAGSGFFIFILVGSVHKFLEGSEDHFIFIPVSVIALVSWYFLANWRNKRLIIEREYIVLKPFLASKKTILNSEIKGFELIETYDSNGLVKNIRINLNGGGKIDFIRDCYDFEEYRKLMNSLHKSELKYLGTIELRSKNKFLLANLSKFGATWALILFILLSLLKLII